MHTKGTIRLKVKKTSSTVKLLKFKSFVKSYNCDFVISKMCQLYDKIITNTNMCVLGRHRLDTEVTWNTVLQTGLIVHKSGAGSSQRILGIQQDAQSLLVAVFCGPILEQSTRKGFTFLVTGKRDYNDIILVC